MYCSMKEYMFLWDQVNTIIAVIFKFLVVNIQVIIIYVIIKKTVQEVYMYVVKFYLK